MASGDVIIGQSEVQVVKGGIGFVVARGTDGGQHLGVGQRVHGEVKQSEQAPVSAVADVRVPHTHDGTLVHRHVGY